jgi:hypothetical protein
MVELRTFLLVLGHARDTVRMAWRFRSHEAFTNYTRSSFISLFGYSRGYGLEAKRRVVRGDHEIRYRNETV